MSNFMPINNNDLNLFEQYQVTNEKQFYNFNTPQEYFMGFIGSRFKLSVKKFRIKIRHPKNKNILLYIND